MTPSSALEPFVREQRLGKKTGRGFYDHAASADDKKKKPELAGDLARFIVAGSTRPPLNSAEEIAERCVLAMLNEAARAIDERVVAGPRELDLATVFGMGFAPFRGGLLRWADTLGAQQWIERLERHRAMPDVRARGEAGDARFTPCEHLTWMVRTMRAFHA